MRRKFLSLLLALTLCLGLAVPAMAAGETVLTDEDGNKYHLSNPVIASGTETFWKGTDVVYQVPSGTTINIEWADPAIRQEAEEAGFDPVTVEGYGWVGTGMNGNLSVSWLEEAEYQETQVEQLWFRPVKTDGTSAGTGDTTDTAGTSSETPSETNASGFSDVSEKDYFFEPVKWAVENKITKGTGGGKFSPSKTCTNAEILTFIWRRMGSPEPSEETTLPNITGSEYYAKAALWGHEFSLLPNAPFEADIPCTRAMTVEYLWAAIGGPAYGNTTDFSDVEDGSFTAEAVRWAVETGVTKGTGGGMFSPDKICTRGEIVTFLYRAYQ